jgi:hypothetical protein
MKELGMQAILLKGPELSDHDRARARMAHALNNAGVVAVSFEEERHSWPRGLSCCEIAGNKPHWIIDAWGDVDD